MFSKIRGAILALSIGLNLAFVGTWSIQAFPGWMTPLIGVRERIEGTVAQSSLHRELGVTPEQWEHIEPLILQFRKTAENHGKEIRRLRRELLDLLAAAPVDEKAIRTKQDEILAGQGRMQNLVVDHLLKEKEILSPNQSIKLIQALCEQCRYDGDMLTGSGLGRAPDKQHVLDGSMDKEKME
ncbi:MAG: periplasmic heavy metal sensor [Deltaproteobacteria bacterium]|nr:periplasmic heavy metal sensor [Deltaproteobacteria bacterium]